MWLLLAIKDLAQNFPALCHKANFSAVALRNGETQKGKWEQRKKEMGGEREGERAKWGNG